MRTHSMRLFRVHSSRLLLIALWTIACGCGVDPAKPQVVVYTALDQGFSAPVFEQFEKETGIQVLAKFDLESTKTVGLVNRLIAEKSHPRCDVFWNNELLHTFRLQKLGILDVYMSPNGRAYPAQFRSKEGYWYGFAGRVRVLLVNTKLVPDNSGPTSLLDLVDPRWKGKVGIAKPLFGTTATHAAVLFDTWGTDKAETFFRTLQRQVKVFGGNKGVAQAVSRGEIAFGLTDTDDAIIEKDAGHPVRIVFPDQGPKQMGAMMIPNSLAVIRDGPNSAQAKKLIEYLLAERLERQLAQASSAQFPLNHAVKEKPRVAPGTELRWMDVNFEAAAEKWPQSAKFLRESFAR